MRLKTQVLGSEVKEKFQVRPFTNDTIYTSFATTFYVLDFQVTYLRYEWVQ